MALDWGTILVRVQAGVPVIISSNAQVMELVYVFALEAKFCGFESRPEHQLYKIWSSGGIGIHIRLELNLSAQLETIGVELVKFGEGLTANTEPSPIEILGRCRD